MEGGDQMPVLFRQVQLVEMTEVVPIRRADGGGTMDARTLAGKTL